MAIHESEPPPPCSCKCWKCGETYPCDTTTFTKFYMDRHYEAARIIEGEGSVTPKHQDECHCIPAARCAQGCKKCSTTGETTIVALWLENRWVPLPEFLTSPGKDGIIEVPRGVNRDRITLQILNLSLYESEEDVKGANAEKAEERSMRARGTTAKDLGGEPSTFHTIPESEGACISWVDGQAAGFYTFTLAGKASQEEKTFIDNFWPLPALCVCAVRPAFRRRGLARKMVHDFYRSRVPVPKPLGKGPLPMESRAGIHLPISNPMLHTLMKALSDVELKNIMLLENLPEGRKLNHTGCTTRDLQSWGLSVRDHLDLHDGPFPVIKARQLKHKVKRMVKLVLHPVPAGREGRDIWDM